MLYAERPPFLQNIANASSNILRDAPGTLDFVPDSLKTVLRENLTRLMRVNPDVDSRAKLARRCHWPRGGKKGAKIAPRTIGYIFEDGDDSPSPTLDVLEAVATAIGVRPWELLIGAGNDKEEALKRLFGNVDQAAGYKPGARYARREARRVPQLARPRKER